MRNSTTCLVRTGNPTFLQGLFLLSRPPSSLRAPSHWPTLRSARAQLLLATPSAHLLPLANVSLASTRLLLLLLRRPHRQRLLLLLLLWLVLRGRRRRRLLRHTGARHGLGRADGNVCVERGGLVLETGTGRSGSRVMTRTDTTLSGWGQTLPTGTTSSL